MLGEPVQTAPRDLTAHARTNACTHTYKPQYQPDDQLKQQSPVPCLFFLSLSLCVVSACADADYFWNDR